MERSEKEIIFNMSFPKIPPDSLDTADEEALEFEEPALFTVQKFLDDYARRYVFDRRSAADRRSKEFISHAIELCK